MSHSLRHKNIFKVTQAAQSQCQNREVQDLVTEMEELTAQKS